jgi:hypothetical protein
VQVGLDQPERVDERAGVDLLQVGRRVEREGRVAGGELGLLPVVVDEEAVEIALVGEVGDAERRARVDRAACGGRVGAGGQRRAGGRGGARARGARARVGAGGAARGAPGASQ